MAGWIVGRYGSCDLGIYRDERLVAEVRAPRWLEKDPDHPAKHVIHHDENDPEMFATARLFAHAEAYREALWRAVQVMEAADRWLRETHDCGLADLAIEARHLRELLADEKDPAELDALAAEIAAAAG